MKLLCAKLQIEIKDIFKEHKKCHRPICAGCQNLFDDEDLDLYILDDFFKICNLDVNKKRGHIVEDFGRGPFYGGEYVEYDMHCEYRKDWPEVGLTLCNYEDECEYKEE
jgi:hypothetical protein